ncbi:MAG: HAD-IA family hydrolase [Muribaculaceae bacterium]|nr:HAD-IA family hydrolase [Muribaculaceae bacterium]MDE5957896.1 HAD-IA family hydrolase [Muribaculaceae bacterium]MDE6448419.1 HAD-IA family hydrolase [Muribaculaceae bacterium]MDE7343026.1 HAD-IA family hydrolase [Muribaculaceae bacterium]
MKKFALIDMDGVLYDSMPYHTLAWQQMMTEIGISTSREEFYLYEGMTGKATIDLIFQRELSRHASDEEASRLYRRKADLFVEMGRKERMRDADRMIHTLMEAGVGRVLVTGSAQNSLISRLNEDYPGAFSEDMRVTALDVKHGKPDPEPYLRGLDKAGVTADEAFVIENAPLGVRAGKNAGIFTIAVTTGPIPREAFEQEGADLIFPSMSAFADALPDLLKQI